MPTAEGAALKSKGCLKEPLHWLAPDMMDRARTLKPHPPYCLPPSRERAHCSALLLIWSWRERPLRTVVAFTDVALYEIILHVDARRLPALSLLPLHCLESLCWHPPPSSGISEYSQRDQEMAQALCKQRLRNEGTRKHCWEVWVKPFEMASVPRDVVKTMCRCGRTQLYRLLPPRPEAPHQDRGIHRKSFMKLQGAWKVLWHSIQSHPKAMEQRAA